MPIISIPPDGYNMPIYNFQFNETETWSLLEHQTGSLVR